MIFKVCMYVHYQCIILSIQNEGKQQLLQTCKSQFYLVAAAIYLWNERMYINKLFTVMLNFLVCVFFSCNSFLFEIPKNYLTFHYGLDLLKSVVLK